MCLNRKPSHEDSNRTRNVYNNSCRQLQQP